MTSKKLGALLRSVPSATVAAASEIPQAPDTPPHPAPRRAAKPTPAEPEVPLQVLIPAGIRKQLALKAAGEGQSLRALVLQALRNLGIEVTEAEIKGKRGRKNA